MPKRKSRVAQPAQTVAPDELRHALNRLKKVELVDLLMELAQADRGILRRLTAQLDVAASSRELATATRQAIAAATDYDELDIHCNFDYDYNAYEEVQRNLSRLVSSGQLQLAMELAVELMKCGSRQVEMSDEGLMSDDIEACIQVVIRAIKKHEPPADEVVAWCAAMLENDRVGFVASDALESLRDRFGARERDGLNPQKGTKEAKVRPMRDRPSRGVGKAKKL